MESLCCLFEDENLYVIHKPPFIPFHSLDEPAVQNKKEQDTKKSVHVEGIVSLAKTFLNDQSIYPVHRLDRMTSGLMIFARSRDVNSQLSKLFLEKKIEKYYLALSDSKPKKKQGAVIGDMSKGRSGSYLLKRSTTNPAVTRFFAKKIIINSTHAWLYVLKPETGKTHQLRVALKSLGSPILGDTRYSGKPASRGFLHAFKVRFELSGQVYEIIDPQFEGQEFSLASYQAASANETPLLQNDFAQITKPELLSWPKSSFLIS